MHKRSSRRRGSLSSPMLGQFGDFSGHWTPEQLAIIHKQGLNEK
jgi:hypothetical protein